MFNGGQVGGVAKVGVRPEGEFWKGGHLFFRQRWRDGHCRRDSIVNYDTFSRDALKRAAIAHLCSSESFLGFLLGLVPRRKG